MRATEHADVEIRHVAVECLKLLQEVAPVVFGDFQVAILSDGSEMATSPFVTDFLRYGLTPSWPICAMIYVDSFIPIVSL